MSGTTCRSGGEPPLGRGRQLLPTAQREITASPGRAAVAMYFERNSATRARHIPTNASDVSLSTDFHACLMAGSVLPQIARLHPLFAFLPAFAGSTHGFPGDAIRLADVLGGAFPALLMDQVKIA